MTGFRGGGVIDAVQQGLPEGFSTVWVLVTQLGDVWFVVGMVTVVYWFHDRRVGAFAIGTVLGALALTVGLKVWFALPRPPEVVQVIHAGGYGFPSGHAIAATVTWGVLAMTTEVWTRRRRFVVAGVVVGAVSLSRIGLGVHYAVDVLAGILVGVVYLGAVLWVSGRDPLVAGGLAAGIAVVSVAIGGGRDAVVLLGGAIGLLAAWRAGDVPEGAWGRTELLPAGVAGGVLGGLVYVGLTYSVALPIVLIISATSVAGVVGLPSLVEWVTNRG